MKFKRSFALATAAIAGVMTLFTLGVGAVEDRTATEVVIRPIQDTPAKGAYVFYDDGTRLLIKPGCKATLNDAGIVPILVDENEIQARPKVKASEHDSCSDILDDLMTAAATPTRMAIEPTQELTSAVLYVTPGGTRSDRGGFVVSNDQTWTHISRTCKADLLEAGIPTRPAVWNDVSAFDQDKSITCTAIQAWLETVEESSNEPIDDAPPADAVAVETAADAPATPEVPAAEAPVAEPPAVEEEAHEPAHEPEEEEAAAHEPASGHQHPSSNGSWVKVSDENARYTDGRVSERYFFFDPEDHEDPSWGRTRIGWLVKCDSVKFDQIDPIVSPGAKSHHLHEFFGNPNLNKNSTTQSLADTSRSNIGCTDVNDKSAYWSPAAFQGQQRVTADGISVYYKSTTPDAVPMPFGLRMIAGDASSTTNQPSHVGWFQLSGASVTTIGATEMIQRQNADQVIQLRINFPNCWDGVHLDSPDHKSHMAYFNEETRTCPSSHPVKVPQVTTFTSYDVKGGKSFSLASGEWFTFHQDFWNAWSPQQMEDLTTECIVAELNCRIRSSKPLLDRGQYEMNIPASGG